MNFYQEFIPVTVRWPKIHSTDLDRMSYHCRDLKQNEMQRLCNMLIDTCKYAPTVPEVIECVNKIKMHRPKLNLASDNSYWCEYCRGTGYVNRWEERSGRPYEFAYGCPDSACKAARDKIPPNYPRMVAS